MNLSISTIIAQELNVAKEQISKAIQLLDEGNTVPFIARYRKEITDGLDDTQLRLLETRLSYLRELDERRQTILHSIKEQRKLTYELEQAICATTSKTSLEDLYLPYKPKRRTRGQIALEAGLQPLAKKLWHSKEDDPVNVAQDFVNLSQGIPDIKAALDGARYILMEQFAEDAQLLAQLRRYLWKNAAFVTQIIEGKETEGIKFKDYFVYREQISRIPSHRMLAILRGRNEGFLRLSLAPDLEQSPPTEPSICEQIITRHLNVMLSSNTALNLWRQSVITATWKVKLLLHLETELITVVREKAEEEAIKVFARNIHGLLMAAPAGMKNTMGLDPGLRTGVKVAIVNATGKVVATDTIYPHTGQTAKAALTLAALCDKYQVELVAIGNGTASRETKRFYLTAQQQYPQIKAIPLVISEAGASIYSASELAALEFPELDVSLRGAVSIARRLQDPLAELVKIDPKSIGVGQYQHDVNQLLLAKQLDAVVEDCVNAVGVDLNTASVPLLARVAGLSTTIAQNIVNWRNQNGLFMNRGQLKQVQRLGPKAFEQCAGFLRINQGDNPLDASAVHPESYRVVQRILSQLQLTLPQLMGSSTILLSLDPQQFIDDQADIGIPTVIDILKELDKPGRDPRPVFKTARFTEGVDTIDDLEAGMVLEGVVTNVTNFGAFVDIGVHQDGLVHISALANHYIDDPHKFVKAGDIVLVKLIDVERSRKRIALSMRLDEIKHNDTAKKPKPMGKKSTFSPKATQGNSSMADALLAAAKKKNN